MDKFDDASPSQLGQASIAGLGAFFTARAVNGLGLPVIVAMFD